MKISPVSSGPTTTDMQGNPAQSRVDLAKIKMNVNATPEGLPVQESLIQPPIETEAAVEATKPLSPQLALLAKQRRALQVERREFEAKKREFESRSSTNPTIPISQLKAEPLRVLLDNGVTYDQLTEAILANQNPQSAEINALKAEINSLKTGIDQKFTEKDVAAEQQVYREMRQEAGQLAEGQGYELVRELSGFPIVMDLIKRTYQESGEVMDVAEALRWVEKGLSEKHPKLAKLLKTQGQSVPEAQLPQQRMVGTRTLTNRDTASVPMSARQRAIAVFNGTLKR